MFFLLFINLCFFLPLNSKKNIVQLYNCTNPYINTEVVNLRTYSYYQTKGDYFLSSVSRASSHAY